MFFTMFFLCVLPKVTLIWQTRLYTSSPIKGGSAICPPEIHLKLSLTYDKGDYVLETFDAQCKKFSSNISIDGNLYFLHISSKHYVL